MPSRSLCRESQGDNGVVSNLAVQPPTSRTGFDPAAGLRRLAGFGVAGGLIASLGAFGVGLPCPWRSVTGTLCPLCGSTHLGIALARGDLAAAWAANSFVFAGLGVLAVLGVLWMIEVRGGPAVRPPRALRWSADRWWLVIGAAALVFAVARNVLPPS